MYGKSEQLPIINSSEGFNLLPSSYISNDFEGLFDSRPVKDFIISTDNHRGHLDLYSRSNTNVSQVSSHQASLKSAQYPLSKPSGQGSSTYHGCGLQEVTINKKELLSYLIQKRLQERYDLNQRLMANPVLIQDNQQRAPQDPEPENVPETAPETVPETVPEPNHVQSARPLAETNSSSCKQSPIITTPLMSQLYPTPEPEENSYEENSKIMLEKGLNSTRKRKYSNHSLTHSHNLCKKQGKTQLPHRYVKVVASKMPEHHKKTKKYHTSSPQTNYQNILNSRSCDSTCFDSISKYFSKPSQLQKASFGTAITKTINARDCKLFRKLLSCGLSPNPSNQFGDSILNTVCRRGHEDLFSVMIDCDASVLTSDQFGRTPLHFACWSSKVNFTMVEKILSFDVNILRAKDKVGKTPLDYISVDKWDVWNQFLNSKKDVYWPCDNTNTCDISVSTPDVTNSSSLPDPKNALSIEEAQLVSSGSELQ